MLEFSKSDCRVWVPNSDTLFAETVDLARILGDTRPLEIEGNWWDYRTKFFVTPLTKELEDEMYWLYYESIMWLNDNTADPYVWELTENGVELNEM